MRDDDRNPAAVRTTIVLCVLVALCEGIDLQAAGVAAPGIAAEFKPAANQLGTFFSASTVGLFLGALVGGRLADSIGRKVVLVTSVALFGLFSLLTPLAANIEALAGARLLTGLGLGGALPMVLALVAETASANRRSSSVAMVYAGTPFGGAIASLISIVLASSQWRWIFVAGGVAPLLLAPVMIFSLRESAAFQRVKTAADVGTLVAMPKRGSFAAIFTERRALPTLLLWVSFFLGLLLLYLLLNWLPTLLVSNGLTRVQAAGAQIGFNIGGALAALLIGYLMQGRLRSLGILVTFFTLPILVIALAKAPAEIGVIAVTVFLLGCSVMSAQAFLYAMAPLPYPTTIRGVGIGVAVAMGRIGSIAGPKLGGALKAAGHGPSQLLMDLLPIALAGSCVALLLAWITRTGEA
ncbi:MAG: transporter, family, 3-hydroxyphenylpropionic acid transporter [Gammaproteobacteria bacterium]|jgi:AAHS family 3-hydroxyphenylpropionic acid transporter|nr:3-(3-hydroxy-phenyl)propionate transporter MhpT [Gammaproteobacteria bacterium]MEA3142559.1 transporter, family, 3-hydroxyphenylpropionic acid transporter [Gammaproteobacteria bacterium]